MVYQYLRHIRNFCRSAVRLENMKYLCVAEKNDAAKTIAGFLSRGTSRRREGYSTYNKIYEFEMDHSGQKVKIVFTSVSGHLLNMEFVNTYRNWTGCNPEQLFDAEIKKFCSENNEKIKRTLEREVRSCNELIIWTDGDREGENIGFEVIDVCRAINRNIFVKRARFSDMTSASIFRAMNSLVDPDERTSQAVDVRSELDLRIGAAFTRFQTLRLQKVFPANIDSLVSYGSCQIPTLGFVAQRYREIENFIPQTFWKIKLTHEMNNLTVEFNWARNRLFDKACCEALLMMCQADGQVMITNAYEKPKNKWRPQPMDTIELEKTGSRKLKMSAKDIMTIAEKLYTRGFISYPRTETNMFSKDMNLRQLVELQTPHREWGQFAERVLEWGPNPRNGNKSDNAHPPIHPTKYTDTLVGDEKRVYELIVRHFLACVSRDAVGFETIVNAKIASEEFTASGLVILERNYLDVYVYDRWTGKEIHKYEAGNTFRPTELSLHEGNTSAPSLLTEADLISLMEKHGIGTDATHAEHIATIKDRGYIGEADRGQLVPGLLGMGLVEGYELMNLTLAQPQLRAGLEVDLKAICDGLKDPQVVLAEQLQRYRECYRIIAREAESLDRALGVRFNEQPQAAPAQIAGSIIHELFKCPKCRNHSMIIRQKKDNGGQYIACQGFPECKHAIWLSGVKEITGTDEICNNCGGSNKKVKIKFNQISMLGLIAENPAYSRLDGTFYITCLVCDQSARSALNIRTEHVKVLGNVVSASSRPIQERNPRLPSVPRQHNSSREFGTQARQDGDGQNRIGWYNADDDDDRPTGGGGIAASSGRNNNINQGWQQNGPSSSGGWSAAGSGSRSNMHQGWQQNGSSSSDGWNAGSSRNNMHQGWQQNGSSSSGGRNAAGSRNNMHQGWQKNGPSSASTSGTSSNTKRKSINLATLPDINCLCNIIASKLIVGKENINKGRAFYTCGDSRKCNFFKWADSPVPNDNNPQNGAEPQRPKRRCGNCRQEGHVKTNCPNQQER